MSSEDLSLHCDTECPAPRTMIVVASNSTPVSPGPMAAPTTTSFRSASPEYIKESDIEPPLRPKSTPFPTQDDTSEVQSNWHNPYQLIAERETRFPSEEESCHLRTSFVDLPVEIHECILDHILGVRGSTANCAKSSRNWSSVLRHSRSRKLSDLALVNKEYRDLVQSRLFKHIKVQGTRASIEEAREFFLNHSHLQKHPRHIDVWIPVWERRVANALDHVILPPATPERTTFIRLMNNAGGGLEFSGSVTSAYQQASSNSTLYEIFGFVQMIFPRACVLTLEGGHCKKPNMVKHFPGVEVSALPELPNMRTLILKSAWNIMRSEQDFRTIMTALPHLREWNTSYAKPKSKSYRNISNVISELPSTISLVKISLEANYSREPQSPRFWRKVYPQVHVCHDMAKALPHLESFTYCGRVCHHFFQQISRVADPDGRGNTKVKAIDLNVKNTCRPLSDLQRDVTGVTDISFIASLETLVVAAIKSLSHLTAVNYLRIRFLDLESPMPLLLPYFELKDNVCTGLWSDKILIALAKSRPAARYPELSDDFAGIKYDKEGKLIPGETFPRSKPSSLKVSAYAELVPGITIH